jgi:hypothetical protein
MSAAAVATVIFVYAGSGAGIARAQQVEAGGRGQAVATGTARGKIVRAPRHARPHGPSDMSPEERAAFERAFNQNPRSGPTNLPRAKMRATGPAGPAQDLK